MPEDVPLGAGYIGSILQERFPNQYRDAGDVAGQEFDGSGYNQAPGAVVGRPRATDALPGQPPPAPYEQRVLADPDAGRPLDMQEIPGVGLVAAPPQAVGNSGMGAVLPVSYPQAGSEQGLSAVVPVSHEMADWRGTPFGDFGEQATGAGGLGTLTEAIGSLVAGRELDDLNRAMFKLNDSVVGAYQKLDELQEEQAKVKEAMGQYPTFLPMPFGPPLPTAIGVVNLQAAAAINEGYRAMTAFSYMVWAFRNSFGQAAPHIARVYTAITSTLQVFENWLDTFRSRIQPQEGMNELFNQIQAMHNSLYAAATAGRPMDFNNDQYLPTALQAVEAITGIKTDESGGGMGLAISTLLAVIFGSIAFIAAAVAAIAFALEAGRRSELLFGMRKEYEGRMEERRKEFMAKREAEGIPRDQVEKEWTVIKKKADEEEDKKESDIAERGAPSFAESIAKALLPIGLVIGGAVLISQAL